MDTMSEALVKYKSVEDNCSVCPCRVIRLIKVTELKVTEHQDRDWK